MKAPQTLYLLAADRDFRLVRGSGKTFSEISHRTAEDFDNVYDEFSDDPGRGQSGGISFATTDLNPKEAEARRRLARHALSALETEWARGRDDRIVLAAGPKMLGELRGQMPKGLAGHVAADMAKDLIKVPVHDLPGHFD